MAKFVKWDAVGFKDGYEKYGTYVWPAKSFWYSKVEVYDADVGERDIIEVLTGDLWKED